MIQVHGTCIGVDGMGVLLTGPSGSGKSDLALRLIDGGADLIADDRTDITLKDGALMASAPAEIAGMIEVRGLGLLRLGGGTEAALGLVADLVDPELVERMPEAHTWECRAWECLGISVPAIKIAPFEASAAAKVRLAVKAVKGGIMPPP